jgi:hypothetical protein
VSADQREVLSFLIALQWTRSRFVLMVVRRDLLGRDTPMDESNRSLGLLNIVASVLDPWAARQRGAYDPKERFCSIESLLAGWDWRVYRPRGQPLVVADNVVSMWGVAVGAVSSMPVAWTRHGMGVGFGNCARITVPLAPDLGLVLTPRGQTPRRIGTAEFNRATIYNSREFVAHHPNWQPGQSLQRAFDEDVSKQRWILPMILEGSTSGRQQGTLGVLLKPRRKLHAPINHAAHSVARAYGAMASNWPVPAGSAKWAAAPRSRPAGWIPPVIAGTGDRGDRAGRPPRLQSSAEKAAHAADIAVPRKQGRGRRGQPGNRLPGFRRPSRERPVTAPTAPPLPAELDALLRRMRPIGELW